MSYTISAGGGGGDSVVIQLTGTNQGIPVLGPWRASFWQATGTQAGVGQWGTNGNVTFGGSSAAGHDDDGPWVLANNTTPTIGQVMGIVSGVSSGEEAYRRARRGRMHAYIKTYTNVADIRVWIGFANGTTDNASDPASLQIAAFRYDTGVDGTAFWRATTKDGTTLNVTTTSVAYTTDTPYVLGIEMEASYVDFFINGALVAHHTANLPDASTDLTWRVRQTTLANAQKFMKLGRFYRGDTPIPA
jgi:hypothetical protein